MLVHHLDAARDGVGGSRDLDGPAVDQDLACVGYGEAVEDVHQGGFAGPVLAEQGVNFAPPQIEVDMVVGDYAGVVLGDAPHLQPRDRRLFRRGWRSCF